MKKWIGALMILGFLIPMVSKASLMGFMDGKYYNETGVLQYFCFADHNCFDINGNLVDMNAVLDAQPQPSYTQANYIPYPDTPTPLVQNPNQPNQPIMPTQSINEPTTESTTEATSTPNYSPEYLALKAQCDSDNAGFLQQQQDIRNRPDYNSIDPFGNIHATHLILENKINNIEIARVARQQECAKQLTNLQP